MTKGKNYEVINAYKLSLAQKGICKRSIDAEIERLETVNVDLEKYFQNNHSLAGVRRLGISARTEIEKIFNNGYFENK